MTRPYAEQFADATEHRLELDGEILYSVVELPVRAPVALTVERIAARDDRVEGLVIDVSPRRLRVAGTEAERITLWADTAPTSVRVEVDHTGPATLRFWNTWRDDGVAQAWVGWAAIRRDEMESAIVLRCHDGHDDGDFDDLVVQVSLDVPV